MQQKELKSNWTRESILAIENSLLQQMLASRTVEATEGAISYARFLRMSGLDTENYPIFLKMLETENHWVLDELIGDQDPFLLLSTIPPNKFLIAKGFDLLTRWRAGGIYPKTLAIVLGILQNAFSSPKDGYKIHEIGIADVDNLGKHLNREKGSNDPQNRCLLDILEKIGNLMGLQWNDTMESVARQAIKIRNCFFDNTKMLEDCIPQVLCVRGDYSEDEIAPKMMFSD